MNRNRLFSILLAVAALTLFFALPHEKLKESSVSSHRPKWNPVTDTLETTDGLRSNLVVIQVGAGLLLAAAIYFATRGRD
jgi:hypothetical protein